jgi:hypothetical protein
MTFERAALHSPCSIPEPDCFVMPDCYFGPTDNEYTAVRSFQVPEVAEQLKYQSGIAFCLALIQRIDYDEEGVRNKLQIRLPVEIAVLERAHSTGLLTFSR